MEYQVPSRWNMRDDKKKRKGGKNIHLLLDMRAKFQQCIRHNLPSFPKDIHQLSSKSLKIATSKRFEKTRPNWLSIWNRIILPIVLSNIQLNRKLHVLVFVKKCYLVLLSKKCVSNTLFTGPSSPSYSVNIVLCGERKAVVDNYFNIRNIQSSSSHISCYLQ